MGKLKHKLIYSALGVSGGLAGASTMTTCAGAACASCFGCVGAGAVLALAMLTNKARNALGRRRDAGA